ncbi:MAG: DUF58 domain-containing protein [Acidimicrobiales bacterium]
MTRRGRLVLGLALALLVAGRILGVTELFGLATAAVSVVLLGLARVRAPQLRVSLSAQATPAVISVGEVATLELTVENSGAVPSPVGRLQIVPAGNGDGPLVVVPRLVPGERAMVSLRLPTDRRGRHEVTGFDVVLVDSLGTARRRLTGTGPSRYGVRPMAEPLSAALPSGGAGTDLETTLSSAERLSSGASLLRPYIVGDDLRMVHWPTTARVGDLMVREGGDRERDAAPGVAILLSPSFFPGSDASESYSRFEDAVRIAASLLSAASNEGSFRLVVAGGVDTGEGTGTRHLELALETLIDVRGVPVVTGDPGRLPVLPRSGLEETVVLFVAACDEPAQMTALFGSPPDALVPPSSALVAICAGAASARMESVSRRHLEVSVPLAGSLEELWSSGEASLVRV